MRYCLFVLRADFYELVCRSIRLTWKADTDLTPGGEGEVRKGHPA